MRTTATATTTETSQTAMALAAEFLRSPAHGWSVGITGAIGEFMYDAGESVSVTTHQGSLSAVTPRGAVGITLPAHATCLAIEDIAECTGGWNQSVAFCVPARDARVEALDVITELGPDRDALTEAGRAELLFDLGLGSVEIRFCVRTAEAALVEVLRAGAGRSVFAHDNPAFGALRTASPARVVLSALGRVEVFQSIAERGGASPPGPHTHLLPGLLRKGSGSAPSLPPGMIAPLRVYPEHPLFDKYGTSRPFRQSAHDAFQRLLWRHGSPDYIAAKARYLQALAADPDADVVAPDSAHPDWIACTIALEQSRALHPGTGVAGDLSPA